MGFRKWITIGFFSAAALLGLTCASALAQSISRPILYYAYMPGVGYVPVYAATAAPVARTAAATYGSSAPAGQPSYYTEDNPAVQEEKPDEKLPARIRVRLPAAAELRINGHKTTSTGAVREFETPELDPDRVYSYLVKAKWVEDGITVEKSLRVRALSGNRVTINFVPPAQERPRPIARLIETAASSTPLTPPPSSWTAPYP